MNRDVGDVADDADGLDGDAVQVRGELGRVWAEQGCRQLLHNRTGQEVSCNTTGSKMRDGY